MEIALVIILTFLLVYILCVLFGMWKELKRLEDVLSKQCAYFNDLREADKKKYDRRFHDVECRVGGVARDWRMFQEQLLEKNKTIWSMEKLENGEVLQHPSGYTVKIVSRIEADTYKVRIINSEGISDKKYVANKEKIIGIDE